MIELQKESCINILTEEISILRPDFVIFFTSSWEHFFLEHIGLNLEENKEVTWDSYSTFFQIFNGVTYVQSQHPQGKIELLHKNVILSILKERE